MLIPFLIHPLRLIHRRGTWSKTSEGTSLCDWRTSRSRFLVNVNGWSYFINLQTPQMLLDILDNFPSRNCPFNWGEAGCYNPSRYKCVYVYKYLRSWFTGIPIDWDNFWTLMKHDIIILLILCMTEASGAHTRWLAGEPKLQHLWAWMATGIWDLRRKC